MKLMRSGCLILALCVVFVACAKSPQTPATQVVVAITSDLTPKTELSRIEVQISKRDGTDVSAMQDFTLVAKTPKSGEQVLPVTFAVGQGTEPSFLLVVAGYGPLGAGGSEEKIVEQRYIATFQPHTTLLLKVFLGRICLHTSCTGGEVCYPAEVGNVKAGNCGAPIAYGAGDLAMVDASKLPDLARPPTGVVIDAGGVVALVDAGDAGNDGGGVASGASGRGGTGGSGGAGGASGRGGTGGTGGSGGASGRGGTGGSGGSGGSGGASGASGSGGTGGTSGSGGTCAFDTDCSGGLKCCGKKCTDVSGACFPWPCNPGTARTNNANCGGCGMACGLFCCSG